MTTILTSIEILLLCMLASCQKNPQWSHAKIHSNYKEFSYSKVTYQTKDPIRGVNLEFIHTPEALKAFIVVHSSPVLGPKKMKVKIEIDDEAHLCDVDRLEGGQRFLLSEETTQMLIEAFDAEKSVQIAIPGYRGIVEGQGFKEHFSKLDRSLMENPFHLPF